MDTVKDANNPYTVTERQEMFQRAYGDRIKVIVIPAVDEVCYGRNVGYGLRRITHEREGISGTAIRALDECVEDEDKEFLSAYKSVADRIHAISLPQGFWPHGSKTDISYKLMHAVSELAEAWECARTEEPDKNIANMQGLEVQLADVLGILMDIEVATGLRVSEALLKKIEFNKTRPYLHGKKF